MASTLPQFSNSVKLKYLKLVYQYLINHFPTLLLMPIILAILIKLIRLGPDGISNLWSSLYFDFVQIMCCSMTVMFIATAYFMSKPRSVYLVDYTCFKPPVSCRVPLVTFLEHSKLILREEPKSVDFQMRILERSGLGEEMCLPPAIHYIPPNSTLEVRGHRRDAMAHNKDLPQSAIDGQTPEGGGRREGLPSIPPMADLEPQRQNPRRDARGRRNNSPRRSRSQSPERQR
ncbi:hypothetical protein HYC85_005259 [Camellia sinensis]|uniref:FAE domain-containing protein n=1 Tax=Camellia sinensis TaxID=4442 RepID=A0A7J7I0V5_CAMSI|nr:hypothetical protein HYC85_005259 [Camellia sinensis]